MGMPQIPEGIHRPSWRETVIDLLESIALEEMAIAHMMNAEGEKAQEVVRRYGQGDLCQREMHRSCRDAQSMMNSFIMKEWLLFSKLNTVLDMEEDRGESRGERCENQSCGCESHREETRDCGCMTAIKSV